MKIYDFAYNAKIPEGMEKRKAYIIGGGMAGLSAAFYLINDAHLPGKNITILEIMNEVGGSMDCAGNAESGYICRGERQLEPYMNCLWNICSKVPSLNNPGRTVLDDIHDCNSENPVHSEVRFVEKQGQPVKNYHDLSLDNECMEAMAKLLYIPESELEDVTIGEYFPENFFDTNWWMIYHSMLAFKKYHSVIESKRYFRRFTHFAPECDYLHGILQAGMNDYDAIIKPIRVWLANQGVVFKTSTEVHEILLTDDNNTVTGIVCSEGTVSVLAEDMVFLTNGSMTQNSSYGNNTEIAPTNYNTENRGVFTLWEKLAQRDKKFGNPEKFISDIDKTRWMSFLLTVTDYPEFNEFLENLTHRKTGTNGILTVRDSSWDISLGTHHHPYFPEQPDNVEVFYGYGLCGENNGDYIKKTMFECTGNEIIEEVCYHLGMLDKLDEFTAHTHISTCVMPYITSEFMPRKVADRPEVVPAGCTNLAFIGQFVETPGDAVFTVETSCRTGMYAAYMLSGIEKEPIEIAPTFYDMRYIMGMMKKLNGIDSFSKNNLPKINPMQIKKVENSIIEFLNQIEEYPSLFPGKDIPKKEM